MKLRDWWQGQDMSSGMVILACTRFLKIEVICFYRLSKASSSWNIFLESAQLRLASFAVTTYSVSTGRSKLTSSRAIKLQSFQSRRRKMTEMLIIYPKSGS